MAAAEAAGISGNTYTDVVKATDAARNAMQPIDTLLITGSFFIVGEALELFSTQPA
jgi:dihydrofolate synthase/folylpolyglutamate synthase